MSNTFTIFISLSEINGWKIGLKKHKNSKNQTIESDNILCCYYRPNLLQCQFLDKGIGLHFDEDYIIVSPKGETVNLIKKADSLPSIIERLIYFIWFHPIKFKIMYIPLDHELFKEWIEETEDENLSPIKDDISGEWWKFSLPEKYSNCRILRMKNVSGWNCVNNSLFEEQLSVKFIWKKRFEQKITYGNVLEGIMRLKSSKSDNYYEFLTDIKFKVRNDVLNISLTFKK